MIKMCYICTDRALFIKHDEDSGYTRYSCIEHKGAANTKFTRVYPLAECENCGCSRGNHKFDTATGNDVCDTADCKCTFFKEIKA